MRKLTLFIAALSVLATSQASALTMFGFSADLDASQVVANPTPVSNGSGALAGFFGGTMTLDRSMLLFNLQWQDLTSTALTVSIHSAWPTQYAAPLKVWNIADDDGDMNRAWFNLSQTEIKDLIDGKWYIQICTQQYSCDHSLGGADGGEIRGQVLTWNKYLAADTGASASPVPEPSAAAVFAVGIGVLGAAIKRRA